MSRFRPRRPSAAILIAAAALFVALGGTGYAAFSVPNNSVGTKQLKNNAVTSKKIKNGAVTTKKIHNGAVTGSKINLSTLGTVPNANTARSATNASHANSAAGLDNLTKLSWRVPTNTTARTIYTSPGGKLTVTAECGAASEITLTLTTSVDHAVLDSYGTSTDVQRDDFVSGTPVIFNNTEEERTVVYTEPGGQTVTLVYLVNNNPNISGVNCILAGNAYAS